MVSLVKAPEERKLRDSSVISHQEWVDLVVLDRLPRQGNWTDEAYLWLTDATNRLIELTDGYLELLPMPTDEHQSIVGNLYIVFRAFLTARGGKVQAAPLRMRVREGKFREPDLLLVRSAADPRRENRNWTGADLVVEVISEDNPERDLKDKRADYAEASIPEYWIVDPRSQTIMILTLQDGAYIEHGVFQMGTQVTSLLLPDLTVAVDQVFSE